LVLFGLENGVLKWEDPAVADVFYKSFTDGLPQEWCAGNYDADELVIDARHRLVEKGLAPQEVVRAVERVISSGSPYPEPAPSTSDLLAKFGITATQGADLLLFAGCAARTLYPASLHSFAKVLQRRGVKFNILDPEPCCGMPLYQLGDFENASRRAKAVAQLIVSSGAKEIVLLDPDCFRMLKSRYTRFGAPLPDTLKVLHVSEWLLGRIEAEKWDLKLRSERYTYHDPISLARFTKVHEPPRLILQSIFGREPLEMLGNRAKAFNCGEGGGMILTNPEIALEAAARRYEQARLTGADLLVTASPVCASFLSRVGTNHPKVKDLVQIVEEAI
jgi:Fe-S oxidoreductase